MSCGFIITGPGLKINTSRAILKNCLFPAPDRLLENVMTGTIFWVIWQHGFLNFGDDNVSKCSDISTSRFLFQ